MRIYAISIPINANNCLSKSMPWPGMDCVFSRLLKRALERNRLAGQST